MARTPTPKQPAATPEPHDPKMLLLLQDIRRDMDTLLGRTHRTETIAGQVASRIADFEKRLDDRITARMAMLELKVVSTTEKALKVTGTLTTEIRSAGEDARREMARTSRMAHMLMERVETAAYHRMREMRDTATEIASTAQKTMTETIEEIRREASILMHGMRNAAVGAVSSLGADTTSKIAKAEVKAVSAIENTAATAKTSIANTALNAQDGFAAATKDAKALADLNISAMRTFETCMADLKRAGKSLSAALERRTWQIARATGLHTAVSIGLGAALYQGVLWILSTYH
jgi:hypothetical protein